MEQIKLPRCMTPGEFIITRNDAVLYFVNIKNLIIYDDKAQNLNPYSYEEDCSYSGLFKTEEEASKFLELYKSGSIVFDTKRNTWVLRQEVTPEDIEEPSLTSTGIGFTAVWPDENTNSNESILVDAFHIVNGSRNSDYKGTEGFEKISEIWNKLYPNKPLTAYDISMVMVILKLVRESITPKKDNLVDACGYLHFANKLTNK